MITGSLIDHVPYTRLSERTAALLGVGGALLLVIGDWLLGGGSGAATQMREVARDVAQSAPLWRLFCGGVAGPLASCLALPGFVGLGRALRHRVAGAAVTIGGGVGMIVFGAVHAVYGTRVLLLRDCVDGCPKLRLDLASYWDLLEMIGVVPAYTAAAVLLVATLAGRTRLPRWTAAANPLPLALLAYPVGLIPAPLGAPLASAWPNLTLAILFAAVVPASGPEHRA